MNTIIYGYLASAFYELRICWSHVSALHAYLNTDISRRTVKLKGILPTSHTKERINELQYLPINVHCDGQQLLDSIINKGFGRCITFKFDHRGCWSLRRISRLRAGEAESKDDNPGPSAPTF